MPGERSGFEGPHGPYGPMQENDQDLSNHMNQLL